MTALLHKKQPKFKVNTKLYAVVSYCLSCNVSETIPRLLNPLIDIQYESLCITVGYNQIDHLHFGFHSGRLPKFSNHNWECISSFGHACYIPDPGQSY
jgi:hypothetical protein